MVQRSKRNFLSPYFCLVCGLLVAMLAPTEALAYKMEARSVPLINTLSTPQFTSVTFQQSYSSPPLIFALPTTDGSNPSALRLRNVTTSGFEIAQLEPPGNDGPHVDMTVDILVVEAGNHTLPDGTLLEAGTVTTSRNQPAPGNSGWRNFNFSQSFSATPAMLTQIQTMNSEIGSPPVNPSRPWLTVAVKELDNGGARIALERSQTDDGAPVQSETIAYLAFEAANGSFSDINGTTVNFQAQLAANAVDGWNNGCDNINFSGGTFSVAPLVLANKSSHNDSDGGWLRRCSLSASRVGLTIDEDQYTDNERSHPNEDASVVAFSSQFIYDSAAPPPAIPSLDPFWKMESNSLTLPAAPAFTTVNFRQSYDTPPLVFLLEDNSDTRPASARIRNVSTTGFEVVQVTPPGSSGSFAPLNIHYVAIEPGIHQLPDGTLIEAGTRTTLATQYYTILNQWSTVNFTAAFSSTPVVLGQLQSMNNEPAHIPGNPSVPWLTTALLVNNANSFELALERSEVNDGLVVIPETVAYLAIQEGAAGSFTDNSGVTVDYETIRSSDSIVGWNEGCRNVGFAGSYASPLVIGNKAGRDGNNGGWLRRCALASNSVGLLVDEDQDRDNERSHTTERSSLLVFGQPFDAIFEPAPLLYYNMDEALWDGSAGEVIDASGNGYHGTAGGNATTDDATPAITGNPGTCRYGSLDGSNDYVRDADAATYLEGLSAITVTAWVKSNNANYDGGIFSSINKGGEDADLGLRYDRDGWGGGGSRVIKASLRTTDGATQVESVSNLQSTNWQHLAYVWEAGGSIEIYVNGALAGKTYDEGALGGTISNIDFLELGHGTKGDDWNGFIDEFRTYDIAISGDNIRALMQRTHPCPDVAVTNFVLTHDGNGIHCLTENIRLDVYDGNGNPVTDFTGTVALDTQTGNGFWISTSGSGTLTDATLNDGQAEYSFDSADAGSVSFGLEYREGTPTFDIDAYDPLDTANRDDDSEGTITFRPYGFVVSPDPIGTQVAGKDFALTLTAAGQTPGDPVCGTIESYTGDKLLKFWSDYTDPASGSESVCVGPVGSGSDCSLNSGNGKAAATSEASAAEQTVTFTNGVATVSFNYPDAGKIAIQAKDDNGIGEPPAASGDELIGGVAPFVVRPFGYFVEAVDNPAGASAYRRVDELFTTNVSAVLWSALDDLDDNGIPDGHDDDDPTNNVDLSDNGVTPNYGNESANFSVALSSLRHLPDPGDDGTPINLNLSSFSNGVSTSTASFDEVGIIELHADNTDYLASGSPVYGRSGQVGRFIPDHFIINHTLSAACGSFTYAGLTAPPRAGQPFTISGTVTAADSSGNTTLNYRDGFAVLTTADIAFAAREGGNPATGTLTDSVDSLSFNNGVGTFSDVDARYAFAAVGQQQTIYLQVDATDSDGVTGSENDSSKSVDFRFGRLSIDDGFAPVSSDLSLTVLAEYYSPTGFVSNSDDSCTTVAAADTSLSNWSGFLQSGETSVLSASGLTSGGGTITLSAPGTGSDTNEGSVMVSYDLSSQPWLLNDENGDGDYAENASAIARFGMPRGDDRIIFWKENLD